MVVQTGFSALIAVARIWSLVGEPRSCDPAEWQQNKTKQNKKLSDPVVLGVCCAVLSVAFQDAHGLASTSSYLVPVTEMLQAPISAQHAWMCKTKKLFAPLGSSSLLSGLTKPRSFRFPWDAVFSKQLIHQLALDPIHLYSARKMCGVWK